MHHLSREGSEVAADMQRSIFVDNIISGCDSQNEAESYFHQANSIMCRANLPLQAWGFSDRDVEKRLEVNGTIDPSRESKTLGLIWNRNTDYLHVQVPNLSSSIERATKRDVLKGTGSFYDPLGFYAPLAVNGKILIQDLCIKGVKLDDELDSEHLKRWREIVSSIVSATKHQIMSMKRSYFGTASSVRNLHVFCDASRRAYGAVSYLVHHEEVSFVESKARITPIKSQQREEDRELSIPESELMAAYLGVLIASIIISALEPLGFKLQVYLWSDSQIVHHWISKEDGHPREFITNRVKKIRDFNRTHAATWKYVSSVDNPADILSRGASFKELQSSKLWKQGPEWLRNRKEWPTWSVTELKNSNVMHVAVKDANPDGKDEDIANIIDPAKYNFNMLLRVTAGVFRLLNNLRLKDPSRKSWNREPVNSIELQKAEEVWIRSFQRKYFPSELDYLQTKKKSWRPALVSQLDLFLDTDGLIKSKGRFQNSTMADSAKYPVLIPKNSSLARLIITSIHEKVFHYGTESTLAQLFQRYWIPSARAQVKKICRSCVKCRRDQGSSYKLPDPAPLPADRVRQSYPFAVTGIDYTGSIPIRAKEGEDSVYILLFTCGVTRAVHLEVVENMTSGAFIDAVRRFTSHHSIPRVIYTDNASTFVSASNLLMEFFNQPEVAKELVSMRIIWKFIPKRAPWYGGWWERLIALTKSSLRKMVGRTRLSLVQLQTVVAQIEAILNDRPLTRVAVDVKSFETLTPAHLLYGRRITTLPIHYAADEELEDPTYGRATEPQILSKAYLRMQNVLRSFWHRWTTFYLPSLREHHQATQGTIKEMIKIGDVVQVHQDSKRLEWKLAVVEQLHRGADGKVRSAEIRTARGKTSRPINKLYPLEVVESKEELVPTESKGQINIEATAGKLSSLSPVSVETPPVSAVRDPIGSLFVSSIPIPVIDDQSTGAVRIQRRAAQRAKEKIKIMAHMETVEEEDE